MTAKESFEEQDKEFEKWRNSGEIVQSIQHLMIRDSWYKADMKYSYRTGAERFEVIARKRTLEKVKEILYVNSPENHLATEIPNAGILGGIDKYIDNELKNLEGE